jgi:putative ABC transport system permease protein
MSKELRSFGANILVRPESSELDLEVAGITYTPPGTRQYLDERELPKIKTIFWRHNVVGFAPCLSAVVQAGDQSVVLTGTWFEETLAIPDLASKQFAENDKAGVEKTFATGVSSISPWWKLQGNWVADGDKTGAIIGSAVAQKLGIQKGDQFALTYEGKPVELKATAIVTTGGFEDNQIFVNLPVVQNLLGIAYGVDKVLVSALVTPDDEVNPEIRGKRPEQMTPEEYEIWYCTPLIESIAYQISEVVTGSDSSPIRQISEAESSFLGKSEFLILMITGAALVASSLSVMTVMNAMVMVRRREIGLMKAIGAHKTQVATIFFLEAGIIGLAGGVLGYFIGLGLAQFIGRQVFGMSFAFSALALPLTLILAVAVALIGSLLPIRQANKIEPISLLRGV